MALLGGASIVVFGLITVAGAKIWIDNKIDFTRNSTLIIAAVSLIMGAGNFSVQIGSFDLGGIGTATVAAILLNLLLNSGAAESNETVENKQTVKSVDKSSTTHLKRQENILISSVSFIGLGGMAYGISFT